jgi:3-methyl-2-oxobutanoate hydroxymethyltransferase
MSDMLTVNQFADLKSAGQKICMLTAYDYTMASLLDAAGVDGILVGDTLGMVVQGHETTLPVTLDQVIYHAEMVGRAVKRALVVVDLPFASYQVGVHQAIAAAARVLKETRCQAVKLEGGIEQAKTIEALVQTGIPVMAHVGLQPQSVRQMGGYRVQRDGEKLLEDARAAQRAGAFAVVVECIPAPLAQQLTEVLEIPTIGIGAGAGCDGQVLVINDLVGLTTGYVPRFVKPQADVKESINSAVKKYCQEVREGAFPGPDQSYDA